MRTGKENYNVVDINSRKNPKQNRPHAVRLRQPVRLMKMWNRPRSCQNRIYWICMPEK